MISHAVCNRKALWLVPARQEANNLILRIDRELAYLTRGIEFVCDDAGKNGPRTAVVAHQVYGLSYRTAIRQQATTAISVTVNCERNFLLEVLMSTFFRGPSSVRF